MEKQVWIVKNKDTSRPSMTEMHGIYTIFSSFDAADMYLNATQKATKEEKEIIEGKLTY